MKYNIIKSSKVVKTPAYVKEIYGKIYENEKVSRFFDDDRIVSLMTLGQQNKMVADVVKEISTNSSVLQMGCTFGKQIESVAEKVGSYGRYVVADVCAKFDTVICYMLLHEVPPVTKAKIINNALNCVEEGGKVIFVDYHNPSRWNLLRFFLKPFNRLYQPFAESMWDKSIESYAKNKEHFSWRKKTYFGRMYQKVVAVRQIPSFEKPASKSNFY